VLSVEVANTQTVIKESANTHSAKLDNNFLRTELAETASQTRTFSLVVSHQSTPVTAQEECAKSSHAVKIKFSLEELEQQMLLANLSPAQITNT
jgi:hypothetical protein